MFEEVSHRRQPPSEATPKILQLEPGQKVTFAATRTPFYPRRRSTHISSKRCVTNQGVLDSKPLKKDFL